MSGVSAAIRSKSLKARHKERDPEPKHPTLEQRMKPKKKMRFISRIQGIESNEGMKLFPTSKGRRCLI